MGLGDIGSIEPYDEPGREEYEATDEELVMKVVCCTMPTTPKADTQFHQMIETARWFIAFETDDWVQRRRKFAQAQVAEERDVTITAVQNSIRRAYEDRAGNKSELELFEESLEALEEDYQAHEEVA